MDVDWLLPITQGNIKWMLIQLSLYRIMEMICLYTKFIFVKNLEKLWLMNLNINDWWNGTFRYVEESKDILVDGNGTLGTYQMLGRRKIWLCYQRPNAISLNKNITA
ncbi:hypothetical protein ACJX0J_037239 [Zea mays]